MSALAQSDISQLGASDGLVQLFGVSFLNDLIGCTLLPASQYLRQEFANLGSAEFYGHELARCCLGNGRSHRMLRGGVSRHPDPTAYGQAAREVFSSGQADTRFGRKARAAALTFQHDQLVSRRTRLNRRCKLVRAGRKARDWHICWQPLLVWRSRQLLGDARSPSWLD